MSSITERVETIRLTATVSNYITGMQQAQRATLATASASQKLAQQGQAMTTLGHTLLAFGTVVAAGVGVAVKSFADFDAKMSQVKTLSSATADEMVQLASAAETLGQKIGISANQAADAELELVKAGVSVSDILGGALQGSLQLAAAGQIDVADATEIATIALTQFKLQGRDVPHVADLLAAGADKALGGVSDLGEALKSGGLVASQFGVSLDETVGTLSAFANAGLLGETAGTDLRQLLLKLANPSAEATAAMKALGISIYDNTGKFVGLSNLAGQLQSKLGDQTEATRNSTLAVIFGSRAIAGANVLYKEGAAGISKWTDEVNTSGFAAKQAAGKMDNLNGDISKLGAAFQKDLITSGSTANDVLRESVQILTVLVRAYGDLPGPIQGAVLAAGALVAVMALSAGTVLTTIPKIAQFKLALDALNLTTKGTTLAVGGMTAALSVGLAIFGAVAAGIAQDKSNADAFRDSLDQTTGALTTYSKTLVATQLQAGGFYEKAKAAGVSQKELTDAVLHGGPAYDAVSAKLNHYAQLHGDVERATRAGGQTTSILQGNLDALRGTVVQGSAEFENQKAAISGSADASQSAADAYQNAATKAQNLDDQISQLVDEINKANGVGQDAISTNASYQKALSDVADYVDKAKKRVKGYTLTLDEHTSAGSANLAMLADLAKKNEDAAKAQFDLDSNTTNYVSNLQAGHDAVVANAEALGATADQAKAIADQVAGIPTQAEIDILVNTQQASQSLTDLEKQFNTLNGAAASAGARYARLAAKYANMPGKGYASGGYTGNGPVNRVAGVVHAGEFVSTARTTANPSNRAALEYMQAGGTVKGYAGGGYVAPIPAPAHHMWAQGTGPQVPVNIKVTGETDPYTFAALAGQAVAARVRGIK